MRRIITQSQLLSAPLCALVLFSGFQATSQAQERGFQFYGAPPPADFEQDAGFDGAVATGPSDDTPGIFARKPINFTFAVREGWDSNLFTTRTNTQSSFYTNWAAGASYSFGTPRLQLNTSLGGGITYYYTRPGDKVDYNGNWSLAAIYKAAPRLTLSINTSTSYLSQPDLTIVGGENRQNGDYLYSSTDLGAAYQWSEKFSTETKYGIRAFYYVDSGLNDNQGRIEQTIAQSGRWLILPRTTGVLEYRANPVTYFEADLNSFGQFFLVGADQVFNPRFTWKGRLGAELRFNNNPVDGQSTYIGPYGESNLEYRFGPASALSWLMRYGTEASGLYNVTQRQTFRTGLAINHAFTKRISMNFGANYQVNYYDQQDVIPSFTENVIDFSIGASFALNRFASLSAGYQFTIDIAPDAIDREYNRSVVFIGANLAF
jgi:hypothetical protein